MALFMNIPSELTSPPSVSSFTEFRNGMRDTSSIMLGYLATGLAFGVVARAGGLSIAEVGLMSLILYAGSAQFIVVALLAAGATLSAIIVTVFLVNVRHLLYSAALAPYVRRLPLWINALIGIELTDETFTLTTSKLLRGRQARGAWFLGIQITAQVVWILSTILGALLGNLLGDLRVWGLDFALPAMFAGLLFMQLEHRPNKVLPLFLALLSAILGTVAAQYMAGGWAIILATVLGASLGLLLEGRKSWK